MILQQFFSIVANAATSLTYLLRDEFTTPQSAPLTSPRTCEPGPGTLVRVTDTASVASISGGKFQATITNTNDPVFYSGSSFARAAGLTASYVWSKSGTSSFINIGFSAAQSGRPLRSAIYFPTTAIVALINGTSLALSDAISANIEYLCILIQRTSGSFLVAKIGSDYRILWIDNADTTANLFFGLSGQGSTTVISYIDSMRVYQMSTPWNDDFGIATSRAASPVVDTTTTSEANAIIEMTWQAVTGQTWELSTRRTNDDNRWIVRCDQAGSTIKIIERNAGVETERSSAAQTWTNGTSYRLVVIQDGNTIRTYVANIAKNTYTSATFNNSATGVKTNRAGTNLVAYPRTLSGAALTELQRWTA